MFLAAVQGGAMGSRERGCIIRHFNTAYMWPRWLLMGEAQDIVFPRTWERREGNEFKKIANKTVKLLCMLAQFLFLLYRKNFWQIFPVTS
jgi:hypothetical protein